MIFKENLQFLVSFRLDYSGLKNFSVLGFATNYVQLIFFQQIGAAAKDRLMGEE